MLYAVWFRRSRTCIYVQLQTPIWMSVHALVIHLQLYYTKHYKNTPAAQHPRSQTNYTSMTRDFSVTRLSLKGITSKCDQAWSHLMGFGGTCRGLSGWDGVISKGRHSPKLFSELKMRKSHCRRQTFTCQYEYKATVPYAWSEHFTSIFKNWSPVSLGRSGYPPSLEVQYPKNILVSSASLLLLLLPSFLEPDALSSLTRTQY